MRVNNLKIILLVGLLSIFLTGCTGKNEPSIPDTVEEIPSNDIEVPEEVSSEDTDVVFLDGEKLTKDFFKGKKLTMINVWGTFCAPCIEEMPDLAELHKEYSDKGFQIMGIVIDVDPETNDNLTVAKSILTNSEATFTNVLPTKEMLKNDLSSVQAIPSTFFVDEDGNVLDTKLTGARTKEVYAKTIEDLLK